MSPPVGRPFPRFIANSAQEASPYGRWAERLQGEFERACEPLAEEAGAALDATSLEWFPERAWGGRVYVPVTGRGAAAEGDALVEYFGHVSFVQPQDGEPRDLEARAEFTDVVAEDNPEWRIDLNDDVIGAWRTDGDRGGDVTLVWGVPMVRGAVAATAELDGEVLDQAPVHDGRFTLVAVDAVKGFGDEMYLEVQLWDRRMAKLAAESLYDEPD
jgi:hypothetical protein